MKWQSLLMGLLTLVLVAGTANAAPTLNVKKNVIAVVDGVDDTVLTQLKDALGQVDQKKLGLAVKNIKDEDLAKLCAAIPTLDTLNIETSKELTSIAPVAKFSGMRAFKMYAPKVRDMTPLAGMKGMMILEVDSNAMGPDLKWMSGMTKLTKINIGADKNLTSFEGIPSLPKLKTISLRRASPADLTPLLALPALTSVTLSYSTIADLTPLTKLPELNRLDLYGGKVKDFSPLAASPKLSYVQYYAVKDADFSTLGKVTQLKEIHGGLTQLNNIDWVANLPNLKKFNVFAEYVTDYSAMSKTNIENFVIWSMRVPVNLKTLGGATSLKELKLWDIKEVSEFNALATLVNMETLILDGVNEKEGSVDLGFIASMPKLKKFTLKASVVPNSAPIGKVAGLNTLNASKLNTRGDKPFNLAFVANLGKLTSLEITDSNVSNFDAVAKCQALEYVNISKTKGISNLAALKKLPNLKRLTLSKDAFPEGELSGFGDKVKITLR